MEDAFNSGNFGMSIPETPSADTPMDGESIVTEDATAEDVPEAMPEEVAPEESPEVAAEAEAEGEPVAEESAEMAGDMPDEPAAEEVAEQAPEEVATPNTLEGAESWLEETRTGSRGSLQDHRGRLRGARRRWRIWTRR